MADWGSAMERWGYGRFRPSPSKPVSEADRARDAAATAAIASAIANGEIIPAKELCPMIWERNRPNHLFNAIVNGALHGSLGSELALRLIVYIAEHPQSREIHEYLGNSYRWVDDISGVAEWARGALIRHREYFQKNQGQLETSNKGE